MREERIRLLTLEQGRGGWEGTSDIGEEKSAVVKDSVYCMTEA